MRMDRNIRILIGPLTVTALFTACDFHQVNSAKLTTDSEADVEAHQSEEPNTVRIMKHDFGFRLSPVTTPLRHDFELLNDSQNAWTVKKIVNTCACSVVGMTKTVIAPGEKGCVSLGYKPIGDGSFDDERKSLVLFNEDTAPKFALYAKAQVRTPLSVHPSHVVFSRVGKGQKRLAPIEVMNFSDEKWSGIEVFDLPAWLTASVEPQQSTSLGSNGEGRSILQQWKINLSLKTSNLPHGQHTCRVRIHSTGASTTYANRLPVKMLISRAVQAIPSQLFFGGLKVGEPAHQSIRLRFSPKLIPKNAEDIRFEHNLGSQLEYELRRIKDDTWEVMTTLNLSKVPAESMSEASFSFLSVDAPVVKVPIYFFLDD